MSKHVLYLGLDPTHYSSNKTITHWPIIQIIPRPLTDRVIYESLSCFKDYSHIIITSKTTIPILKNYLSLIGIDFQTWREKLTLAIGEVTAKHLTAYGINRIKIAQEETAEGMIQELLQLSLKEAHIFWPHSSKARPVIKDFLIKHHIPHTTCPLYDPQPYHSGPLPSLEAFDEIVFTSPSTVEAFLHFFGKFPLHAHLHPIGPITKQFLEQKLSELK